MAHQAVRGISLDIEHGCFYTLLGPSGCGKTTTLRAVAGLERPDSGRITVGATTVCDPAAGIFVEPNNRNIGMVFQSYAIWPHMTVFDNVAFPLRHLRPKPKFAEIRSRVLAVLSLVKLDGLESRPAPFLSGGQQQRLALARALVFEPQVLLLDEPLSNLDAKLREDMRGEISGLVKRLRITTLFVTHEQIEALTMSDRIGLMRDGAIVQEGTPAEIYGTPRHRFVAEFVGKMNTIVGRVATANADDGYCVVETPLGLLTVLGERPGNIGEEVLLVVRPENLRIVSDGSVGSHVNSISAVVERVTFLGNLLECIVTADQFRFRLQLHPHKMPQAGQSVTVQIDPSDLRVVTE
ncbi:MAG: ABC transporter ATP-binding protein [Xanthobacteraceae bacterium]